MTSIVELEEKVAKLGRREQGLFGRIFELFSAWGELKIPATFRGKVREYFGRRDEAGNILESEEEVVARIESQRLVRIRNRITGEEALFNRLRAERPGVREEKRRKEEDKLHQFIEEARRGCDFCDPEKYTSEDVFGRVRGKHSITAANLAKYDAHHGLVIFDNHNPLEFTKEEFFDYLATAFSWFAKVEEHNPRLRYPFLMWNSLPRAGASQVHGHMQVLMSRDYYARVSALFKSARRYREEYHGDYFADLYRVHDAVGLAHSYREVKVLAHLTPVKEKEIMIIGDSLDEPFREAIFKTLRAYIDRLSVMSFNLSFAIPVPPDDFPYIVRMVDRGSIFKVTSDIGAMELYGTNVIASDPYKVIEVVREFLRL